MPTAWCAHLRPKMVPMGTVAKSITLVLPFYENHIFLLSQLAHWWSWPADLRERVSVILVDDGSPIPLQYPLQPVPVPLRLFRIEVDVRWNWLAARNIGAHHADDGWLLLTDMDHVLPTVTLQSLVYGQHDEDVAYVFNRLEHNGELILPHSASFFMTRKLFWRVGGYDERLAGYYGTDGAYRRRLTALAPLWLVPEVLVRWEHVADSSTRRYGRKQAQDTEGKLLARRLVGTPPATLTFPYHEVPCL